MTVTTTDTADVVVRIENRLPRLHLEHTFAGGRTTAVVGPNGAGKTTLLRALAGLLRADVASVAVGDDILSGPGLAVPPHRRNVALLSQDARLFPHLSVADNVAFAPRAQRLSKTQVNDLIASWLHACEVADLADRKPSQLSGGQAQRVAIARALAAQPRILLLDEPFRALDVDVAGRLRALLRDLLAAREQTTIMVTHDVVDVVTLADDALVFDNGRVADRGPVPDVLHRPANSFAASLAGLNLVSGVWDGAAVVGPGVSVAGFAAEPVRVNTSATAVFGPDAVVVATSEPTDASFRNVYRTTVSQVVPQGDRFLLRAEFADQEMSAELTREALAQLRIGVGSHVWLAVKASAVRVY
ncbi:molybdate ABC transporter ATP-binding protein [Gordonia effusa NBRC 100432]|uniref:Molybdate ABC transporter ATP-binding protein n=1 Tax=Gordonia effusa NBRC 100432 TaxID=1077974 RepID=H0R029_9ACTN|nr:ABC transporter ATP-binding protein [Gordonia effusa]GAB18430.1 molybdate ABC transporter ATP-binding protein [Gordonia effusa NBRC 100432]